MKIKWKSNFPFLGFYEWLYIHPVTENSLSLCLPLLYTPWWRQGGHAYSNRGKLVFFLSVLTKTLKIPTSPSLLIWQILRTTEMFGTKQCKSHPPNKINNFGIPFLLTTSSHLCKRKPNVIVAFCLCLHKATGPLVFKQKLNSDDTELLKESDYQIHSINFLY